MNIPVYLIVGLLDAGKTSFINDTLRDGFALQERTLLLCCEEGDQEYDRQGLRNVAVVNVEEEGALTPAFFKECEKKYRPAQVLIEYNGMWPMEPLFRGALPKNWILYQIMALVDAPSFDVCVRNMGQIMMEKLLNADLIIFNRCTEALADSLRKRNLRMANRRADIFLEFNDGSSENYATADQSPFDLSQSVTDIPDDDFGIWYVDVMDHPERYAGKKLRLKLMMFRSKQWDGVPCPGRFAMVCCAQDIQFLGVLAKGEALASFQDRAWMEALLTVEVTEHPAYQGAGPIMNILEATPTEKPEAEVVSF